jgi:hypothetical protein
MSKTHRFDPDQDRPRKSGNSKVFYTSCPASFDYPSVTESRRVATDSRGRDVRRVMIEPDRFNQQTARYRSGAIYLNVEQAEFDQLVHHNLVTDVEV